MLHSEEVDPEQVPRSVRWAIARGTFILNVREQWRAWLDALKTSTRNRRQKLDLWFMRQRARLFVRFRLAHIIARQTGRRSYTWQSLAYCPC